MLCPASSLRTGDVSPDVRQCLFFFWDIRRAFYSDNVGQWGVEGWKLETVFASWHHSHEVTVSWSLGFTTGPYFAPAQFRKARRVSSAPDKDQSPHEQREGKSTRLEAGQTISTRTQTLWSEVLFLPTTIHVVLLLLFISCLFLKDSLDGLN